jgi:1-acyl-sn-glycerol-3-phosphate acyltransferase
VKHFLLDPFRTVVTVLVMMVLTALAGISVIVIAWFSPRSPLIDRVARAWSRPWLVLTGTRLEVRGDVADRSQSYIVISNHGSWLDIMANFIAGRLPIRFLAKQELFKVPFMGQAMRAIGMVAIDRGRAATMHEAINEGVRKVAANGASVMVYPEGTRTRDGAMRSFKRGAFHMAIDNGLPLLPVTIAGSYHAWPPGWIARGGRMVVQIGDPIPVEGLTRADVTRLMAECHDLISTTRERLDAEREVRR